MGILRVSNLCKNYPGFRLKNVSFDLEEGKITGFIGRNGAGKSTTLKAMLNVIHSDGGEAEFFGMKYSENENLIKQRIGFVSGGFDDYVQKKLSTITAVTSGFYADWDGEAYAKYMRMFKITDDKTPAELSQGMKVKYSIALALSHNAKLLILDEPTSGLDPVSRDELLDIFMDLCDKGVTILFSTHIISDLTKCADNIIYIRNGEICADEELNAYVKRYKVALFRDGEVPQSPKDKLIGMKRTKTGYSALIRAEDADLVENAEITDADLESIMLHYEREGEEC